MTVKADACGEGEAQTLTGQALYRKAKRLIPGGTQLLSKRPEMFLPDQWPAYYARAQGARVWDLEGRQYVDMSLNGIGACPLGFADPEVNAAVKAAVDAGTMSTLNCPEEVELAERLCMLHPWAEMVRYTRSGGEAMAVAVRVARARTRRQKVAFCGYHGWSDWYLAANLSEADALGSKGLLLSGLDPAGVPQRLGGTALAFRQNRIEELKEIVARNPGALAAVVCEPQRAEKPEPGFLAEVKAIAHETGAVLIFDEITSAMRLNTGGVHLLLGVNPDIAVFAKGISNGFAMGAVIGTSVVMQAAQESFISSTYWTEKVGPVAALATLGKHQRVRAYERQIAAGRQVMAVWRHNAVEAGLEVTVGHPDMPPLAHVHFDYPNSRAVQTLHCQLMLQRGYLDNTGFYATYAHSEDVIDEYKNALLDAWKVLATAVREGRVEAALGGPVGHSGFARLTT